MKQDELRFYEAAFTLCLGDKKKVLKQSMPLIMLLRQWDLLFPMPRI